MIDENKITGMIPAKAIGCLGPDDELELQNVINGGTGFPWDELGKFQTAAALFPLALQLEMPDGTLKDNVALRLIKLTEEQRLIKLQEEEALRMQERIPEDISTIPEPQKYIQEEDSAYSPYSETESVSSDNISLTEMENADLHEGTRISDDFPGEHREAGDTEIEERLEIPDEISAPQDITGVTELLDEVARRENTRDNEPGIEFASRGIAEIGLNGQRDPGIKPDTGRKALNEKMFRALEQEIESLKDSIESNRSRAGNNSKILYIIIAVLIALFIFGFFKFTADIELLEKKIEYLQKKGNTGLMYGEKPNGAFFLC